YSPNHPSHHRLLRVTFQRPGHSASSGARSPSRITYSPNRPRPSPPTSGSASGSRPRWCPGAPSPSRITYSPDRPSHHRLLRVTFQRPGHSASSGARSAFANHLQSEPPKPSPLTSGGASTSRPQREFRRAIRLRESPTVRTTQGHHRLLLVALQAARP